MQVVKVSAHSVPKAVAGAIAGIIRDGGAAEVHTVGAGAVNQAAKAIAVACVFLREEGTEIICRPEFMETEINGETRTAIRFVVEKR